MFDDIASRWSAKNSIVVLLDAYRSKSKFLVQVNERNWSDETLGDVVEGVLATGMRRGAPFAAAELSRWFEECAGASYSLLCYFPQVQTRADLIEFGNTARARLMQIRAVEVD